MTIAFVEIVRTATELTDARNLGLRARHAAEFGPTAGLATRSVVGVRAGQPAAPYASETGQSAAILRGEAGSLEVQIRG